MLNMVNGMAISTATALWPSPPRAIYSKVPSTYPRMMIKSAMLTADIMASL